MGYSYRLIIPLAKETVFHFFYDFEKWFRLNPQWEVLSLENGKNTEKGSQFNLSVKYDRTEDQVKYKGIVEEFMEGNRLTVRLDAETPRLITIKVDDADQNSSILSYDEAGDKEPTIEEKRELSLWVKSIGNYILLSRKSVLWSKIWKWFVDRIWLKLSPSGRRIVFFIVISEVAAFAFFLLLILWLLIFKKI